MEVIKSLCLAIFKFVALPGIGIYILAQFYRTSVALNHILKGSYTPRKRIFWSVVAGSIQLVFVIIAFWCIFTMNRALPIQVILKPFV